jgi:hypothetical protein
LCSGFAVPIFFVKMAEGLLWICVDYYGLNKIIARDRYPLPYIDDVFDKLYRLSTLLS